MLSDQARILNPLHPGWFHFSAALLHFHQNRHEEVLVDVQRISMPEFYWTHLLKAAALGHLGRKEASASLAKMTEVKPGVSATEEILKWNIVPREVANIMEGLRKAGLT